MIRAGVQYTPQERYRLALAAGVVEESREEPHIIVQSTPNRWTGKRSTTELSRAALDARLEDFWLNTRPSTASQTSPADN